MFIESVHLKSPAYGRVGAGGLPPLSPRGGEGTAAGLIAGEEWEAVLGALRQLPRLPDLTCASHREPRVVSAPDKWVDMGIVHRTG